MESEIRELDHKREQNKEELFEKEIESEDQQNKLTHYKELYDGFFYLVTMLREKQKKLLRSKGIVSCLTFNLNYSKNVHSIFSGRATYPDSLYLLQWGVQSSE